MTSEYLNNTSISGLALGLLVLMVHIGKAQDTYSLPQAIDYALSHHVEIKVKELDAENAVWQYREAKSIGVPKVKGNVRYTYFYQKPVSPVTDFLSPAIYGVLFQEDVIEPRDLGPPNTFEVGFVQNNQLTFGLGVDAMIFDGNYLKGLKAAKLFMALAEKQVELSQQDIIHQVTRAYQNVLVAQRNIEIVDNNISNLNSMLSEARETYESGFIEELDVDRLQVSLDNLNIEKQKLVQLVDLSKNVLKYQMAYPLEEDISVSEELETVVEKMILSPITFIEDLDHAKRPEHRLLVDAIELDEADLVRIKQGYLPTVYASLNYDQLLQRDDLFNGLESGLIPSGSIEIRANIPIYDGGFTKSRIEQKKIELEKREIELDEFDRAMKLQVNNAFVNFQNAKWTLERSKEALRLNEKIYNKTQIKYREGVGSSVEVSQAESNLYEAQARYVNALYDALTTKTELDIATGEILER